MILKILLYSDFLSTSIWIYFLNLLYIKLNATILCFINYLGIIIIKVFLSTNRFIYFYVKSFLSKILILSEFYKT